MLQKIVAPVLCCAMALSLAGCRLSTPATVLTVDGTDISAGLYLLYQLQAYTSAQNLQTDSKTDVLKDTLEDKKGDVWVADETQRLVRRYMAIEKQFEADGLTMTDDERKAAQQSAKSSYASNAEVYGKNGIGEQSFTTYYLNEMKYDMLVNDYNDANAEKISDTDAKAYMDKKYNHVATLLLPITNAEGAQLSEEELAKVQAIADTLEKDLSAGGDMETLAPEALKEAFAVCGTEYTEEALTQYQSTTFIQEDSTYFDADTTAAIFEAKEGGAGQAPIGTMPMLYQKLPNYEDDADFTANYRETIARSMCLEEFDAALKTAGEALSLTADEKAVKTYSPKKIVLS